MTNKRIFPGMRQWEVLVVDDDPDVQRTTELALADMDFMGKRLCLTRAYSAKEAFEILEHQQDFAVVMLDVVMESSNAGLHLVRRIRDELQMDMVRIIIRTGQPGNAPEFSVSKDYEIDGYLDKKLQDQAKLLSMLRTSIRSYVQLVQMNKLSNAMQANQDLTNALLALDDVTHFGQTCAEFLPKMMGREITSVFGFQGLTERYGTVDLRVVAATGYCKDAVELGSGAQVPVLKDGPCKTRLRGILKRRSDAYSDKDIEIYINIQGERESAIWLHDPNGFDYVDDQIIANWSNTLTSAGLRMALMANKVTRAVKTVSIFAHAFRTPLSGATMYVDLLLKNLTNPGYAQDKQETILTKMRTQIQEMTQLINVNLRNAETMLKIGPTLRNYEPQTLWPLVKKAIETAASVQRLKVGVKVQGDESCQGLIDPSGFIDVLHNVLNNAVAAVVDAARQGENTPQVCITVGTSDEWVVVEVRDEGVGMYPEVLEKVFRPFFTSSKVESHGLGLTVAQKIMHGMGGRISVESQKWKGTAVTLRFYSEGIAENSTE